jgi:hypothetical protein
VKEFLVNEEDTVTVGQDLLKMELAVPRRVERSNKRSRT